MRIAHAIASLFSQLLRRLQLKEALEFLHLAVVVMLSPVILMGDNQAYCQFQQRVRA